MSPEAGGSAPADERVRPAQPHIIDVESHTSPNPISAEDPPLINGTYVFSSNGRSSAETNGSDPGPESTSPPSIIDVESHTAPVPPRVEDTDLGRRFPSSLPDPDESPFITGEQPVVNGATFENSGPVIINGAERAGDVMAARAQEQQAAEAAAATPSEVAQAPLAPDANPEPQVAPASPELPVTPEPQPTPVPPDVSPQPGLPGPDQARPALTPQELIDQLADQAIAQAQSPDQAQSNEPIKIAIVDQSRDLADRARDAARTELNEAHKVSLLRRVWHGFTRPYREQQATNRNLRQMTEAQSLYGTDAAGQASQEANNTRTVERFLSNVNRIHEEAGESRVELGDDAASQTITQEIQGLLRSYVDGTLDEAGFEQARHETLTDLSRRFPDQMGQGRLYADNLLAVAQQIRLREDTEAALAGLQITLGEARNLQRTEAQYSGTDRIMEKLENIPGLGRTVLANEASIALGIAAAVSAGSFVGRKVSSVARLGFVGVGSAAFAGLREHRQFTSKREQHLRDVAVGDETGPDSPQRERLDATVYEMRSAQELSDQFEGLLMRTNEDGVSVMDLPLTPDRTTQLIAAITDTRARMHLSDTRRGDLIRYTDVASVQEERDRLTMFMALSQTLLERQVASDPVMAEAMDAAGGLEAIIQTSTNASEELLMGDIEDKDTAFRSQRRKAVAKRMAIAGATGLAVGAAIQEVRALIDPNTVGIGESGTGAAKEHHTALRGLKDLLTGNNESVLTGPGEELAIDESHTLVGGGGAEWVQNPDGTYSVISGERHLADGLTLKDGVLDQASADKLRATGVTFETSILASETADTPVGTHEFLANHAADTQKISRNWMNNDTAGVYDMNELRMDLHMSPDGNYQYDMNRMFEGGSFRGAEAENIQNMIQNNEAKLLVSLSKDTQGTPIVFEMKNGIVDIDPNGPYGQLIQMVDGQPKLAALHAEIGREVGMNGDKHIYNILATDTGKGVDSLADTGTKTATIITSVPGPDVIVDAPDFVPVPTYTPLEPTRRGGQEEEGNGENPTIVETSDGREPVEPGQPGLPPIVPPEPQPGQPGLPPEPQPGEPGPGEIEPPEQEPVRPTVERGDRLYWLAEARAARARLRELDPAASTAIELVDLNDVKSARYVKNAKQEIVDGVLIVNNKTLEKIINNHIMLRDVDPSDTKSGELRKVAKVFRAAADSAEVTGDDSSSELRARPVYGVDNVTRRTPPEPYDEESESSEEPIIATPDGVAASETTPAEAATTPERDASSSEPEVLTTPEVSEPSAPQESATARPEAMSFTRKLAAVAGTRVATDSLIAKVNAELNNRTLGRYNSLLDNNKVSQVLDDLRRKGLWHEGEDGQMVREGGARMERLWTKIEDRTQALQRYENDLRNDLAAVSSMQELRAELERDVFLGRRITKDASGKWYKPLDDIGRVVLRVAGEVSGRVRDTGSRKPAAANESEVTSNTQVESQVTPEPARPTEVENDTEFDQLADQVLGPGASDEVKQLRILPNFTKARKVLIKGNAEPKVRGKELQVPVGFDIASVQLVQRYLDALHKRNR